MHAFYLGHRSPLVPSRGGCGLDIPALVHLGGPESYLGACDADLTRSYCRGVGVGRAAGAQADYTPRTPFTSSTSYSPLYVSYVLLPAESVCRRPSHAYQEGGPETQKPKKTGVAAPAHMTATARGAASATTQCARRGEITAVTPSAPLPLLHHGGARAADTRLDQ